MRLSRTLPAVLLVAFAQTAAAQSAAPSDAVGAGSRDGLVAVIDVTRLPIDLQRI